MSEPRTTAAAPAPSPGLLLLAALFGAGACSGVRWLAAVLPDAQLQAAATAMLAAFAAGALLVAWRPPADPVRARTRAGWTAALVLPPADAAGLALLGAGQPLASALVMALPHALAGYAFAAELAASRIRIGALVAAWCAAAAVGLGAAVFGLGALAPLGDAALALAAGGDQATADALSARAGAVGWRAAARDHGWDALGHVRSVELHDRAGRATGAGALVRDFTFTAPLLRADHPFLRSACGTALLQLPSVPKPRARVLLAGLGGGTGLVCALAAGATQVDVAEPSPQQERLVRAFLGAAGDDPRVRYHRASPRAFARRARGYDLVVLETSRGKHGLPPGLLPLPETALATTDRGLADLLDALSPNGTLWASARGEPQALRLAQTARAALARLGVQQTAPHLAVHRSGELFAITVGRAPLGMEAVLELHRMRDSGLPAGANPADAELLGLSGAPELLFTVGAAFQNRFFTLLAGDGASLERSYVFDLSAPSDDRPLFDEQTRRGRPEAWAESATLAGLSLRVALAAVAALLALGATARRLRPPRAAATAAAFFCIGTVVALGYAYLNHAFGLLVLRPEQGLALAGLALPALALLTLPFTVAETARPLAFAGLTLGAVFAAPLAPALVLLHGYAALGLTAIGLLAIALAVAPIGRSARAAD